MLYFIDYVYFHVYLLSMDFTRFFVNTLHIDLIFTYISVLDNHHFVYLNVFIFTVIVHNSMCCFFKNIIMSQQKISYTPK